MFACSDGVCAIHLPILSFLSSVLTFVCGNGVCTVWLPAILFLLCCSVLIFGCSDGVCTACLPILLFLSHLFLQCWCLHAVLVVCTIHLSFLLFLCPISFFSADVCMHWWCSLLTDQKEIVSALLSKAGLQTEKKACALADYLNIAIQFDEFSKVGWGRQVQGAYRAANHYILVVVYCAQGHCTTFMIISLCSPPGKDKKCWSCASKYASNWLHMC